MLVACVNIESSLLPPDRRNHARVGATVHVILVDCLDTGVLTGSLPYLIHVKRVSVKCRYPVTISYAWKSFMSLYNAKPLLWAVVL